MSQVDRLGLQCSGGREKSTSISILSNSVERLRASKLSVLLSDLFQQTRMQAHILSRISCCLHLCRFERVGDNYLECFGREAGQDFQPVACYA